MSACGSLRELLPASQTKAQDEARITTETDTSVEDAMMDDTKTEQNIDNTTMTVESIRNLTAGEVVDTTRFSQVQLLQLFSEEQIVAGGEIYERINEVSYHKNDNLAVSQLRYLRMLYYGFDGQTHVGEMIVNEEIAADVLDIFKQLYAAEYPIERMQLVDDYGADDDASMAANNSSAFNYRCIAGTTKLSNHSWGKAIDINPLYNPYVYTSADGTTHVDPEGGEDYTDRNGDAPYMIDHEDLCYQLFIQHGFSWGGDWETKKDYQHFEKL
jgi:hypothetical protein